MISGRRFYPSRGIGPIGVGWSRRGRGRGVCRPGGRRVAGGVERPGAGGGGGPRRRVGRGRRPDRAGPGGVEGAAVGGRGAGGLSSGTGAQLRGAAAARGGVALSADGVRPRQRHLGFRISGISDVGDQQDYTRVERRWAAFGALSRRQASVPKTAVFGLIQEKCAQPGLTPGINHSCAASGSASGVPLMPAPMRSERPGNREAGAELVVRVDFPAGDGWGFAVTDGRRADDLQNVPGSQVLLPLDALLLFDDSLLDPPIPSGELAF